MCTVTYLPLGNSEFILTSNRDERVNRAADYPKPYRVFDTLAIFPRDKEAKGTWFAATSNRFTLCLLNGAFEKHKHNPPYRKSRGLMLLDFFRFNDVKTFINEYDFSGIEPFTLLIFDKQKIISIDEIRWDGTRFFHELKDARQPHIWSSATLYSRQTIREREQWFRDFLDHHPEYSENDILQFHHFGGRGDKANDLMMNRDNFLKTVSITSVTKRNDYAYITYEDTLRHKIYQRRIS